MRFLCQTLWVLYARSPNQDSCIVCLRELPRVHSPLMLNTGLVGNGGKWQCHMLCSSVYNYYCRGSYSVYTITSLLQTISSCYTKQTTCWSTSSVILVYWLWNAKVWHKSVIFFVVLKFHQLGWQRQSLMWSTGESLIMLAVEGALLYQLGAAAEKLSSWRRYLWCFISFAHVLLWSLQSVIIISFNLWRSKVSLGLKNLPQEWRGQEASRALRAVQSKLRTCDARASCLIVVGWDIESESDSGVW